MHTLSLSPTNCFYNPFHIRHHHRLYGKHKQHTDVLISQHSTLGVLLESPHVGFCYHWPLQHCFFPGPSLISQLPVFLLCTRIQEYWKVKSNLICFLLPFPGWDLRIKRKIYLRFQKQNRKQTGETFSLSAEVDQWTHHTHRIINTFLLVLQFSAGSCVKLAEICELTNDLFLVSETWGILPRVWPA